MLARWIILQNSSPWFGRGANLSLIPYTIIVGPVEVNKGIPGLIETGMKKKEARKRLGNPLVKGLTTNEAERRGFIDPEDISDDFYNGIFAWIQYGKEDKVISITFDLAAFAKKFHGNQQVLLQYNGQMYLLSSDLSQDDIIAMFHEKVASANIKIQKGAIIIENGTILDFDSERSKLNMVTIIAL